MGFKVSARMILEMGAELIGSDGVAFYELIKNAFDAGSSHIEIDVINRVDHSLFEAFVERINEAIKAKKRPRTSVEFKTILVDVFEAAEEATVEADAPLPCRDSIKTWEELLMAVDDLNFIRFTDYGSGMTLDHLEDVYLVLGTRDRLIEKEELDGEGTPPLGEKGIGRLSVMRLGNRLSVKTSTQEDAHWNYLPINWRRFSHDSDELLKDVPIEPIEGEKKRLKKDKGTTILISGLKHGWSKEVVADIAENDVSRFMDPFTKKKAHQISMRFQNETIPIPRFENILFKHAHATCSAKLELIGKRKIRLSGEVNYGLRNKKKSFRLEDEHLLSVASVSPKTARQLGPFNVEIYWYNRRILTQLDGIGDRTRVKKLVNDWSGGLMVFRDGFRVLPYGGPNDDWLELDGKALSSQGYKVNRKQLIGKVDIGGFTNPALTDQTNREGLRDCDEKHVMQALLRHILESEFRAFLNNVDKELDANIEVSFKDIQKRFEETSKRMKASVKRLLKEFPEVKEEQGLAKDLRESTDIIHELMQQTSLKAKEFKKGRNEMLHLAGLGGMVEFVAHELNRATESALKTLGSKRLANIGQQEGALLKTLRLQLKTLQKRLRILDPMSTPGRQVKESFQLRELIQQIVDAHEAQLERHGIEVEVEVIASRGFTVRMVKGMVIQIVENLLNNSIYWLKHRKRFKKTFRPKIFVSIDSKLKQIQISDNGPGVDPSRAEEIFQAFVTTKPPGHGKGLGLYISREIAKYHDFELYLSSESTNKDGNYDTFVLDLGKQSK